METELAAQAAREADRARALPLSGDTDLQETPAHAENLLEQADCEHTQAPERCQVTARPYPDRGGELGRNAGSWHAPISWHLFAKLTSL